MKTVLLGDFSPTEVTSPLFREKDIETLFNDVPALWKDKDFLFVNLECALTDHDKDIMKYGPALKAPAETADVLRDLGVDCCGLSNNHIFDFGRRGARDTMANLDRVGIPYTGFGKDYEDSRKDFVVECDGEKISIITVCEHEYSYALDDRMGSRPWDEFDTMDDIRKAKETSDRVIVIYHGGKEYCRYPSPRLRRLCRAMVRNGADAVLCQHSHCIGAYELYQGGHILYGQGNFHFVKNSDREGWYTGLVVFYDTTAHEMTFEPIKITDDGKGICRVLGEEKEKIMAAFARRNEELQTGAWKDGWHTFCVEEQGYYKKVLKDMLAEGNTERQNGVFGHYLDCEAHTDVWRELFPTWNQTNEKEPEEN